MKRLLRTIPCERGKIYYSYQGNRYLLAECEPEIEIYEESTSVPVLGSRSYGVKRLHMALAICGERSYTLECGPDVFQPGKRFSLSADVLRQDGIYEVFHFEDMIPEDIALDGNWVFSLNEPPEVIRRLLMI